MLGLSIVLAILFALGTAVVIEIRRTLYANPDPRTVHGSEMTEIGRAVLALLDETDEFDPKYKPLEYLKSKLLNRGQTAVLSPSEIRLAYTAIKFQKRLLLFKLSDQSAWASVETLQDYKMSLSYIRQFELKFREGFYISVGIGETSHDLKNSDKKIR